MYTRSWFRIGSSIILPLPRSFYFYGLLMAHPLNNVRMPKCSSTPRSMYRMMTNICTDYSHQGGRKSVSVRVWAWRIKHRHPHQRAAAGGLGLSRRSLGTRFKIVQRDQETGARYVRTLDCVRLAAAAKLTHAQHYCTPWYAHTLSFDSPDGTHVVYRRTAVHKPPYKLDCRNPESRDTHTHPC